MSSALTDAMSKVVEVLSPLSAEERLRVVNAALVLLGGGAKASGAESQLQATPLGKLPGVSAQASTWLAKNNLTKDQLEQWFHFEQGNVRPIALPGAASKRIQQATNSYLVQGLAAFFATGEPSFTDREARDLCEHFGCYDENNHSKVLAAFGNRITGSKTTGWKLTAPGLSAAAALLKS